MNFIVLFAASLVATAAISEKIPGSVPVEGFSISEFPKHAKISPVDAAKIAKNLLKGEIASLSLEESDGYLIYVVDITDRKKNLQEVHIDAGNGRILVR